MSAKVEVEEYISIAVLVVFFLHPSSFGLFSQLKKKNETKPLNRGCLYLLFCRTCKTTVYLTRHGEAESNCATVTNCLGLFNAADVAYSGYRVRKVWLKRGSVLNDKDAIFHMHKADLCCMLIF